MAAPANISNVYPGFRYRERPGKRAKALNLRLSEAEHAELKQRARYVGTSMADLARRLVFRESQDQK